MTPGTEARFELRRPQTLEDCQGWPPNSPDMYATPTRGCSGHTSRLSFFQRSVGAVSGAEVRGLVAGLSDLLQTA